MSALSIFATLVLYLGFAYLAFRFLFAVLRVLRVPLFTVGIFGKAGPFYIRTRR